MVQSAYIHIPFCKSKCNYCSFVSFVGSDEQLRQGYADILIKEIKHFYKQEPLKTLYFGGGTPSIMNLDDIKRIVECFNLKSNTEITIEVNPETVDLTYLQKLRQIGFNRISIGIQSFDNKILKYIGRIHSANRAIKTVKEARAAGFKNISTDFIYGLPYQTQKSFLNDLDTATQLGVEHISLYGLKIEEGCNFYKNKPVNLADDDMQADMYLAAIDLLKSNGYLHYEISNFAKKGCESKHNLNYWSCGEYYGFGVAAHGYTNGVRYSNFENLQKYMLNYKEKQTVRELSLKEKLEEYIYLGFRKGDGIDVSKINRAFGVDFEEIYKDTLKKYTETKHMLKTENGYKFSNEGYLLSNIILSDFL